MSWVCREFVVRMSWAGWPSTLHCGAVVSRRLSQYENNYNISGVVQSWFNESIIEMGRFTLGKNCTPSRHPQKITLRPTVLPTPTPWPTTALPSSHPHLRMSNDSSSPLISTVGRIRRSFWAWWFYCTSDSMRRRRRTNTTSHTTTDSLHGRALVQRTTEWPIQCMVVISCYWCVRASQNILCVPHLGGIS